MSSSVVASSAPHVLPADLLKEINSIRPYHKAHQVSNSSAASAQKKAVEDLTQGFTAMHLKAVSDALDSQKYGKFHSKNQPLITAGHAIRQHLTPMVQQREIQTKLPVNTFQMHTLLTNYATLISEVKAMLTTFSPENSTAEQLKAHLILLKNKKAKIDELEKTAQGVSAGIAKLGTQVVGFKPMNKEALESAARLAKFSISSLETSKDDAAVVNHFKRAQTTLVQRAKLHKELSIAEKTITEGQASAAGLAVCIEAHKEGTKVVRCASELVALTTATAALLARFNADPAAAATAEFAAEIDTHATKFNVRLAELIDRQAKMWAQLDILEAKIASADKNDKLVAEEFATTDKLLRNTWAQLFVTVWTERVKLESLKEAVAHQTKIAALTSSYQTSTKELQEGIDKMPADEKGNRPATTYDILYRTNEKNFIALDAEFEALKVAAAKEALAQVNVLKLCARPQPHPQPKEVEGTEYDKLIGELSNEHKKLFQTAQMALLAERRALLAKVDLSATKVAVENADKLRTNTLYTLQTYGKNNEYKNQFGLAFAPALSYEKSWSLSKPTSKGLNLDNPLV